MFTEESALEYLRDSLPEADMTQLEDADLVRVARHALRVNRSVSWGERIPEGIFRAFVLFPRINDEAPVFYHETLWNEIAPRLAGKDMRQAVLEVNCWCSAHVTYQSTDGRTADPLTVMRRASGRCGEESTLLVAALRACGLPARQVYVPRWSHCDDNHAWVEAWVDGAWHYLGACEPEPELDSGWFTAAASRAMLVHTRAYGLIPENEEIASVNGRYCIINRTAAYAETRRLTVIVTAGGNPKKGLTVRFELANMAELYPIHTCITDENGQASLLTGLGTLNIHVTDGKKYICADADNSVSQVCCLDFDKAVESETGCVEFDQRAPAETRIQPAEYPETVRAAHEARLRACEKSRADYRATFDRSSEYTLRALGNHAAVTAFLRDERFAETDKRALLDTLRYKDFADVTQETLADALAGALPFRNKYPDAVWRGCVLAPRVGNEMLYPDRMAFAERFSDCATYADIAAKLDDLLMPGAMQPESIIPRFSKALEAGRAPDNVRKLLFVYACRARGIAARLAPATGEPEVWSGGAYQASDPARQPDSVLRLVNHSGEGMVYGAHFSVGKLENGMYRTLELPDTRLNGMLDIPVCPGRYRVLTMRRQIDGSVDGRAYFVVAERGKTTEIEIAMRPDRTREKLLRRRLPALRTDGGILPDGQQEIIAVLAPGAEPTEHFLNELMESAQDLAARRIKVALIVDDPARTDNAKLKLALKTVKGAALYTRPDHAALLEWRRLLRAGDLRLPLAVSVDKDGNGLFAFTNYNVGSVRSLTDIIRAE